MLSRGLVLNFFDNLSSVIQNTSLPEVVIPFLRVHGVEEFLVVDDLLELFFGIAVQLYSQLLYHFEQLFVRNSISLVNVVELKQSVYTLFKIALH